jgi:predicted ester cyclase/quercetin dioxygenase-like cupin family protein
MNRSGLLLATCALAAATAFALLSVAASVPGSRVAIPLDAASRNTVLRFYSAVNNVLRTGDETHLDPILAPDFVDREPVVGISPDRAGLGRHLAELHASFPRLHLTVDAVMADGDMAMARVTVEGGGEGSFLGIPLAGRPIVWGRVERFRIVDGRVVERWADTERLSLLQPLSVTRVDLGPPLTQTLTVERVTGEGGARHHWPALLTGQRLLVVEAGSLTVLVDAVPPAGEGATPQESGSQRSLAAGEDLLVPERVGATTRAEDGQATVFLVVTMTVPETISHLPAQSWAAARNAGMTQETLAGGMQATLPSGSARIAIGRATLAPGEELPTHQTAGPELVAVEGGRLGLTISGEPAWIRRGDSFALTGETAATLTATDGALVPVGSLAAYRNDGEDPLALLLVTISPAEREGPS